MKPEVAIIIGAGPAGLTAAYELLQRTKIKPIVLEKTTLMGGLASTVNYKGNRIDVGGHRFFSKSDRVMEWWLNLFPLERSEQNELAITYHHMSRVIPVVQQDPPLDKPDQVMLIRNRKSRICFSGNFFEYPLQLNKDSITKLGMTKFARILTSYLKCRIFPLRKEKNLEDFMINRFGDELYRTFFKSYTEKVWGVPCREISADWGAQRIKGLSIAKLLQDIFAKMLRNKNDILQKTTQVSLIERFLYPKFGPGQLWEETAKRVEALGGKIITNVTVNKLNVIDNRVHSVDAFNAQTGKQENFVGNHFFSTMPVKDLVRGLEADVPKKIREIADGLMYRDFITVGVLAKKLARESTLEDNWIYIQDPKVRVGRIQFFNNWSPYMVSDPTTTWMGLEYYCFESDPIWRETDQAIIALAVTELQMLGLVHAKDVLDAVVIRTPKAYPAYFGTYSQFSELQQFLDNFENLYLIGRNGMHKYNNQDHSMLTAMTAVDNIAGEIKSKHNIWAVNAEGEYLEEKKIEEKENH